MKERRKEIVFVTLLFDITVKEVVVVTIINYNKLRSFVS